MGLRGIIGWNLQAKRGTAERHTSERQKNAVETSKTDIELVNHRKQWPAYRSAPPYAPYKYPIMKT